MEELEVKAYAKINFAIDLLGKREDNYNEVKMIMQTVDIFDKVIIKRVNEGILIESDVNLIPKDNRNVAYKASEYIQSSTIRVAFVSTNSITQGEHVPIFWNHILLNQNLPIATK